MAAVLHTGGVQFASEKAVVERALCAQPGVVSADCNPVAQTTTVAFDPRRTSIAQLRSCLEACGYECAGESVPSSLGTAPHAQAPSAEHAGHTTAPVHGQMAVHAAATDPGRNARRIRGATAAAGQADTASAPKQSMAHGAHAGMVMAPEEAMGHGGHAGMSMAAMVRDMRNRFLVALVLSIPIVLWSPIGRQVLGFGVPAPFGLRDDIFQLILSLPVVFYSASIFFQGAVRALRQRTLDMMVLVAVAIGTGWLYSVVITLAGGGDVFYEAASVLATFVLLGHWFEMRARGGANDAIRTLLDLAPAKAIVIRDGQQVEVPTAELAVGDLLFIRPGAKVPVDATVEEGESEVDESMVTGESLPVAKTAGSELIGASINTNGTLRARALRVGSDTALAQIVKLVQEAQNSKAPSQRLADRAAFWLVLVALVGGVGTLVVWLLTGAPLNTAVLFAITVVVITCPDALGLATPTAIMVGTGLGAKRGILFKNAAALEAAAHIQVVVMDKTGTLTKGEPEVVQVTVNGTTEVELLRLAAALERESEHPLARAVVKRAEAANVEVLAAERFENVPGHGATATVDGHRVAVGNTRLMERETVALGELDAQRARIASEGQTVVWVAVDGKAVGLIAIADAVRPTSKQAVAAFA